MKYYIRKSKDLGRTGWRDNEAVKFYGPFASKRDAMKVYYFHRSLEEREQANNNNLNRLYVTKHIIREGDEEIASILNDPGSYGYVSAKLFPPTALRKHPSWKKLTAKTQRFLFNSNLRAAGEEYEE